MVSGLPIFRVGEFTDFFGNRQSWTLEQLQQMKDNFDLLREARVFPNVPVREDHFSSISGLKGYIIGLQVRDELLLADVEFTEKDGFDKWQRGTYRGRSIEIGAYKTNDEEEFYPVVRGLAFVDLPAVEGLFSAPPPKEAPAIFFNPEERQITMDTQHWERAAVYAKNIDDFTRAAHFAQRIDDWTQAANYAQALDDLGVLAAQPLAVFQINGSTSNDHAAVQAHIDTLEQFRSESIEAGRRSFIHGLAEHNVIAVTQEESLVELALSMTEEQFATFRKSYEGAPVAPGFARHAAGNPTNRDGRDAVNQQIADLEKTVSMHRAAGMTEEQISETDSSKRLAALKGA